MQDLSNKHVLVFGASSGMGKAISQLCLQKNMTVSVGARRKDKLAKHFAHEKNIGLISRVDVTNKQQVIDFVERSITEIGQIDYTINCVGVMYYQYMQHKNYDEWMEMVDTNIIGFLHITNAVIAPLVQSKGMFINVSSDAGRLAFPGLAVYSGTKAFMEYTIKSLRQELIESGVRLINIQPGNVATPLQYMSTDQAAIAAYASNNVADFLAPEDIANAMLYAMQQPRNVALNEILIEPQQEPI